MTDNKKADKYNKFKKLLDKDNNIKFDDLFKLVNMKKFEKENDI